MEQLQQIAKIAFASEFSFALKSQKNICMVDSSKFLLYGTFNWISLDRIDIIISDKGLGSEIADKLVLNGVEVLIAR